MTVPFFFELRASSVLCVVFRSSEGRSKAGLDEREEPLQCWECKVDWYQYSLQIVQHTFLFSNQFYILSSTETMKFVTYLFAFLSVANIALAADDKECEGTVALFDLICSRLLYCAKVYRMKECMNTVHEYEHGRWVGLNNLAGMGSCCVMLLISLALRPSISHLLALRY
jgi:hypothetical protein